ncbi:MAG TPA: hypothetical protein VLA09_02110 [Longimicrobiales bacterium]|nr:hypothetical protein [Longimicrobiales bacterium]
MTAKRWRTSGNLGLVTVLALTGWACQADQTGGGAVAGGGEMAGLMGSDGRYYPPGASGASVPAGLPQFAVDPFWPRPLPNNWILGQVSGLDVDEDGNVWIIHRPWTVQGTNAGSTPQRTDRGRTWGHDPLQSLCCTTAPPVVAFDPDGNVIQAWGGSTDEYEWFNSEHGIHVDYNGFVWVAGNGQNDHHMMKFTMDGDYVSQIGAVGVNQGSNDTESVNQAAIMITDPEAQELYVADGYGNHRVIVFDAETGEYKRHWGAYGERPVDEDPGPWDPNAPPSRTWRQPVHAVVISNDGLVYVADRPSNRISVFQKDGTFVREAVLARDTYGPGAVWDFALDPTDSSQQYLFVPDGTNNKVWILDRESLEPVYSWGQGGRQAGQFDWLHNMKFNAQGDFYTAEVQTGHRVQKFVRIAN